METRNRIPFDAFSANLTSIFDRVARKGEEVVVERTAGERVALEPVTRAHARRRVKTQYDDAAFLTALEGWGVVDIHTFFKDNAESRGRRFEEMV